MSSAFLGTSLARHGRIVSMLALLSVVLTACGELPTMLDKSEEKFGIKNNFWGADHREFHRAVLYPNGVGFRFPGYIVGIEKSRQQKVNGPRVEPELLTLPEGRPSTKIQRALMTNPKSHLITHVMRYSDVNDANAVFPHRIKSCAVYSLLPPSDKGDTHDAAQGMFSRCEISGDDASAGEKFSVSGAFEQSWIALADLKKSLEADLRTDEKSKVPPISHIFVIVMGWNTPQGEAVQNFNSIIGHMLDEVDEKRKAVHGGCGEKNKEVPECRFRPLLIGVTWASDWELSPLLPLPPALVRAISFPNKANDAKEVGITWLRALIEHVVLPVRNGTSNNGGPKIVLVGHSFGARALMASVTENRVLNTRREAARAVPQMLNFRKGDQFVALQGAFKIEELFVDEKELDKLHPSIANRNLRVTVTSSEFDEAVDTAFWGTYAGSAKGYDKVCAPGSTGTYGNFVDCSRARSRGSSLNYGFASCNTAFADRTPHERLNGAPVHVFDVSEMVNCRSAFTGGGSHSDIYRREMARFLWDQLR